MNLGGACWWCGSVADSGEHKFKRSDLVRAFGAGVWTGSDAVSHGSGGRASPVKSSRADRLKFPKVMCQNCNNARSQAMDAAYDTFSAYIANNEEQILRDARFQWSDIFTGDWKSGREEVARYWVKHICTRLATEGVSISAEVIEFLDGVRDSPTHLEMELGIRLDIVELAKHLRTVHGEEFGESFWMGDVTCYYDPDRNVVEAAWSHWGLLWLRLEYVYRLDDSSSRLNFWRKKVGLPRGVLRGSVRHSRSMRRLQSEVVAHRAAPVPVSARLDRGSRWAH
ncbi:hypothetical protein [Kribbella sancticallisti]|uniref:hypothetical protein n=1 Tax=Kribbella sancticallisti TaxID=460087 RepID=UPI0031CEA8C9